MAEREIDVVVFGAASVTGRRVAAYLGERVAARGARWAAAARNPDKLERVLAEVGVEVPVTIAADVGEASSLREMAERARVIVNLVGPYTLYGEAVIAACVDGGAPATSTSPGRSRSPGGCSTATAPPPRAPG